MSEYKNLLSRLRGETREIMLPTSLEGEAANVIEELLRERDDAEAERDKFFEWYSKTQNEKLKLVEEINRLKRGYFTDEEFQALCHNLSEEDLAKFKLGCYAYWKKLFGTQSVKYSVDDDGVEWYRFDKVTVAVRGGKEAVISPDMNGLSWYLRCGTVREIASSTEEAEAWCRKQLVPVEEWRPATVDDIGKPCRVKYAENGGWVLRDKIVVCVSHLRRPWVVLDDHGDIHNWRFCEVRK